MDAAGLSLTAAELLDRTRRGADLLRQRGIGRGHFVAVDAGAMSWTEAAVAYFAVTWLGAAAVMTTGEGTARLARGGIGVGASITPLPACEPDVTHITPAELVSASGVCEEPLAQPGDRLDLVFTSGTTGEPKPVASTHAQWTRSVRPEIMTSSIRRVVGHTGVPIAVSGGLHGVLLNHLARGVTSVQAGTVAGLISACRLHHVCELHMTPHSARAVVRQLAAAEPWTGLIRVIRVVGGPVPGAVAADLAACFPNARIVSLYGLTEGGAALCVKRLGGQLRDSIGRPAPGTEVSVLDARGRELPRGQVGELAVRTTGTGPLSYYQEESLNAEWFPGSWARTGDIGFVDQEGNIRLVGRGKELIFLRGGRVSPETIEEILAAVLPDSIDFAVVGVRSDDGWDKIAVFLGGDPGSQRIADARGRLAAMKGPFRPDLVRVTSQIPRGPFGKPLRRLLVQDAAVSGD